VRRFSPIFGFLMLALGEILCYDMNERSFRKAPMPEESSPRGDAARQAILQAAHDLFVEQGYHGTSMRQVAQRAGVALGGLYNHFTSKEAVFEAVFLTYHPYHEVLPHLLEVQGGSTEEFVSNAAQRMAEVVRRRPDLMNLMFIEHVEFQSVHIRSLMNDLLPLALQIVQRLSSMQPERLRPIPPPMLVRSFLGMFLSYYFTEIIFTQVAPGTSPAENMQQFVDIYLHGILRSPTEGDLP